MSRDYTIAAFDPSISKPGCAIITQHERIIYIDGIRTDTKASDIDRLNHIASWVHGIMLKYKPDAVAVEKTFTRAKYGEKSNYASSGKLYKASGVIIGVATIFAPVVEYMPSQWQKPVTGTRSPGKDGIKRCMELRYGEALNDWRLSEDKRDALAIATYAASMMRAGRLCPEKTNYPSAQVSSGLKFKMCNMVRDWRK
jgi:Holliday junction resolvasome RuvABC endonuclease subunit